MPGLPLIRCRQNEQWQWLSHTDYRTWLCLFLIFQILLAVIGFCKTGGSSGDFKLWITRRSLSKRSKYLSRVTHKPWPVLIFPGLLDIVVGGSINLGERNCQQTTSLICWVLLEDNRWASCCEGYTRSIKTHPFPREYHLFASLVGSCLRFVTASNFPSLPTCRFPLKSVPKTERSRPSSC